MELILNNTDCPTLCLNMIVKNESKIITRLFDSVASIIDCYCICDTGSTDNTVELITEYFQNKNIPGKIVKEPFKNFCHNRNFSLQSCLGMSDYILLLDADMVLQITNFNKNILKTADNFYILQGSDSFYYRNMRIIKNNALYKYFGVTHEYIDVPNNNTSAGFDKKELFIQDFGDGGSKHDKFERDIRLLSEGIKEEPKNSRYYFYLANSYHDSGKFDEAINVYKQRITFGGWNEEVWYSYYRIGLCLKNTNRIDEAISYWLNGYDYYPDRLEGLYEILNCYRMHSRHRIANMIYQQARTILDANKERSHHLFLYDDIYTSKIYYEYTIIAAYVGIKNINYEIIKVLNNSKYDTDINNMLTNMKYYKDVLTSKYKVIVDSTVNTNINNQDIKLYSSSSCLIPNTDKSGGYKMNIRYVNYYINNVGGYLNCDKNIITVNKYVELDAKLEILFEKWLDTKFEERRYIGIEDVRVFYDVETNRPIFIGTGYHKNNNIGIVAGEYDYQSGSLNSMEIVPNFINNSCEKNWVYVDYNNSTHVIYEWFPLKICKISDNTDSEKILSLVETRNMPAIFKKIRGSTCGFKYSKPQGEIIQGNINIQITEDEIWFVTHIVSYEQPRHYYHVIAVFDSNMNLLRYSAPFKFEGEPIEYCLSILVEDERVLINYSTWDRTTRIGVYDKKYIDSIVKYSV
jgi:tetratricopeptide (TPR) repeat protein